MGFTPPDNGRNGESVRGKQRLGPKDRQLVAPSVRAGNFVLVAKRPEGPVQIVARLRRSGN